MSATNLTTAQADFVLAFVCAHMDGDDKVPCRVVEESHGGDLRRYAQAMAEWHNIRFCDACGKSNKDGDYLVFHSDVEGKGIDLCGACGVEYFGFWRLKNAPIGPEVETFVMEKRLVAMGFIRL